ARLPKHRLVAPAPGGIATALEEARRYRRCVLWLDNVDRHLHVDADLTAEALTALVDSQARGHCVVVATLTRSQESQLKAIPEDAARLPVYQRAREVLERAHRVTVPRLFTAEERARAKDIDDARIAVALARSQEYGLAEYLANGPRLLAEWDNAWSANTDPHAPSYPRGAALIAAAVELRRAGYLSALPRELLEQVHTHYLDQYGGQRLHPEPLARAWEWALKPRFATTHLLTPTEDDTGHEPGRVEVFDYLVDATHRRTPAGEHAPEHVITAALEHTTAADAHSIGTTAYSQGRYPLAERAYRQAHAAYTDEHGP
ncbi:tetratricopeptide repeat protein, partial [Lipingzhangella sp. LS1_29]|nr:tetratricopeptide repeat protein [Lipingzhangella rawalii]